MTRLLSVWTALAVLCGLFVLRAADEPGPAPTQTVEERLAKLEAAQVAIAKSSPAGMQLLEAVWDSGLKFRSTDGGKTFAVNVGGRMQFDVFWVAQTTHLRRSLGAANAAINTDEAGFRRLRFEMGGTIYERALYKLELDFNGGAISVRDAFIGFKYNIGGDITGSLRFGSTAEPGQLGRMTSDLFTTFIERAMLVTFHPDYSDGIWLDGAFKVDGAERFTWFGGLCRDVGGNGNDTGAGKNGKYNASLRLTALPLYDSGKTSGHRILFHIGAMGSLRNPNTFTGGIQTVAFSARPETSFGPLFLNTGNVAAQEVQIYGFELAGVYDRLWFAGEYVAAHTIKPTGAAAQNAFFDGYYLAAGIFVTGESRGYKLSNGSWSRITPKHVAFLPNDEGGTGLGAIEIAARYDFLDLEDRPAAVYGGAMTTVTGALNWYPNSNLRVMFNYVYADLNQRPAAGSRNRGSEQNASFRCQADF